MTQREVVKFLFLLGAPLLFILGVVFGLRERQLYLPTDAGVEVDAGVCSVDGGA